MHSKPKLLLAVLTSPGAAFEEILERRLLGTALIVVAAAGVLSTVAAALRAEFTGPMQFFALGKYNPLAWFGLYLLYALALQKLLKWIGTEIDYLRVLIILGWAQVSLVIVQALATTAGAIALSGAGAGQVPQFLDSLSAVLYVAYVAIIAVGVRVATGAPASRGAMAYTVIAIVAIMGFAWLYGNSRMELFAGALPGVAEVAQQVVAVDTAPWLAAAVVGLALGFWHLAKALGWDVKKRNLCVAVAGVIGAAVLGSYVYVFSNVDYYGDLLQAQRYYDTDKFDRAAEELKSLTSSTKYAEAVLYPEIAGIYFVGGNWRQSISYQQKFMDIVKKAKLGKDEGRQLARPLSGIGAVYDQDRKYDLAIKQFEQAAKAWPEFRDPWVRLSVTYDRLGRYDKAIEKGEHATKKLGSRAAVAYVALAQAYAQTGDAAKAKAAFEEVKKIDDELARKIGAKPDGWKRAVEKLTVKDLKFPLEREIALVAKKPVSGKKEGLRGKK